MHEFIYDGLPSSVFGAYIASSNFLDGASRDVSPVMIPGRNGNLNLDNKRFNNFTLVENLYIRKDIVQNADALRQFLAAHSTTYYPIEEDFTPEIFRMARYSGAFAVETFDHVGGAFSIEFDCKPQRFLKSGTVMQEITSGSTLNNSVCFSAVNPDLRKWCADDRYADGHGHRQQQRLCRCGFGSNGLLLRHDESEQQGCSVRA